MLTKKKLVLLCSGLAGVLGLSLLVSGKRETAPDLAATQVKKAQITESAEKEQEPLDLNEAMSVINKVAEQADKLPETSAKPEALPEKLQKLAAEHESHAQKLEHSKSQLSELGKKYDQLLQDPNVSPDSPEIQKLNEEREVIEQRLVKEMEVYRESYQTLRTEKVSYYQQNLARHTGEEGSP
jgi:predicted nuclease with TOPRIM domain